MTAVAIDMVPLGNRRRGGDRRTQQRLRELCDEVLASYRLAQGQDLLSDEDREVASELLPGMTPALGRAS